MTIKFYNEILNPNGSSFEIAKLNNENINKGVTSTIINAKPLFLTPNGDLYYGTTDHSNANFETNIKECLYLLTKTNKLTNNNPLEILKSQYEELKQDYNSLLNNEITAIMVRKYLNFNCLPYNLYDPYKNNLYNNNSGLLIKSIIKAKMAVLYYFISNYDMLLNSRSKYFQNILDNNDDSDNLIRDFAVEMIGFDKIENKTRKTITTSKSNIYETFFNYYLMDFDINIKPRYIYDKNSQEFILAESYGVFFNHDIYLFDEINAIKEKTLIEDRTIYFR